MWWSQKRLSVACMGGYHRGECAMRPMNAGKPPWCECRCHTRSYYCHNKKHKDCRGVAEAGKLTCKCTCHRGKK